ncbi:MAG TPA: hybrid sensor histidine kinase/response regulator [Acidobacteriota bacterium]|nr:hybrid sensor histidine kinase/response regulator [Acidobacteriota bacterium]HQF88251.1 hybrid sensor histidine kinase/response regulator [Acidobacteriota bacterium]HQG92388.1 hybrid sensor histidine kinase/response regulator [Acidobacteriota bacterium]
MHNPPRLLLVDDVAENLVLLEAIFTPEGYATRSAGTGADALRIARAEVPDLVLLDVLMPGQDGFAVCRALRADAATRFIPVIMVTALNELEDRIQGLEAGADDFISKPFSDDLLLAKVRSLLKLKQSRDELEALKTDFANMIVHDLRMPTHAILGLAELLREDPAGGDARRMLELIITSARKIDQQITDFLEASRLEAGRLKLQLRAEDVVALARRAMDQARPGGRARQIRLELDAPSELVARVDGDRLGHVFLNLIQNAMKFSPAGGTVTVRIGPVGDRIEVTVDDEGPGIPETDAAALFEKYIQGERRTGGVGLGLFICKTIVEAHGGRIRAENRPGGGARFRFELPLQPPVQS